MLFFRLRFRSCRGIRSVVFSIRLHQEKQEKNARTENRQKWSQAFNFVYILSFLFFGFRVTVAGIVDLSKWENFS